MSELGELLEHALNLGDPWRRINGTRPAPTRGGVHVPSRNTRGQKYSALGGQAAHRNEVVIPRATFDDYAAIVTFDAAEARRMARLGFRRMEFERGELPPGVKVWVR